MSKSRKSDLNVKENSVEILATFGSTKTVTHRGKETKANILNIIFDSPPK